MHIKTRTCTIRNENRIALLFDYDKDVITLVKQIEGRKWSASRKLWYIPYQENALVDLNKKFKGKLEFIKQAKFPPEYIQTLKQGNYSEPTIKSYRQHFQLFMNYYPGINPEDITQEQIREYVIYMVETKNYSVSSQNNAINAIRFYYTKVLHLELEEFYAPRPRRPKITPKILNEKEVALILINLSDQRDKCMIFLVYSAGLTPSEIVYLKPEHIDSKNMKIFISSAKGDKDRYVVLADKLLILLREYFKKYKPKVWLFESFPGKQYSKRKLQKTFQTAVKETGITKPATLTILKNSFAVHLLDKGVDIRYIQKMLGHKHSKTTMKYLKVSKRDLSAIQSPLDSLDM